MKNIKSKATIVLATLAASNLMTAAIALANGA